MTQLVLHLGERGRGKPAGIGHPNLNFAYHVRHIRDLDPQPLFDSHAPGDAVLAILCGNNDIRGASWPVSSRSTAGRVMTGRRSF
ncbi:hypothetical protein JL100_011780 [Skermanella mucosa]|uniref:hypothetical protein n=1 Tax=Skermanella mucosa TaxID=1789672 RepID=UPI00192B6B95|nr:hypothetical protein [Skermanella mucosa]UEM23375.1 hypothetical protein JL100_011780 [Skermanella mucosa]